MTLYAEDLQRFVGGQARVYPQGDRDQLLVLITKIEQNSIFTNIIHIHYGPGRVAVWDDENNVWVYRGGLDINQVFLVQELQSDRLPAEITLQAGQVTVWDEEHESVLVLSPPGHPAQVNLDEILGVPAAERG